MYAQHFRGPDEESVSFGMKDGSLHSALGACTGLWYLSLLLWSSGPLLE